MDIVVRVKPYLAHLIDKIRDQVDEVRETKTDYIVKLRRDDEERGFIVPTAEGWVPEEFYFDIKEHGGKSAWSSEAQIVCGLSGKKLKPYYVPAMPDPGGAHAFFCIPAACVTVTAVPPNNAIVKEHFISLSEDGEIVFIDSKLLWSGDPGTGLPPHAYKDAVKAAIEKLHCLNCSEPHYAIVPVPPKRRVANGEDLDDPDE